MQNSNLCLQAVSHFRTVDLHYAIVLFLCCHGSLLVHTVQLFVLLYLAGVMCVCVCRLVFCVRLKRRTSFGALTTTTHLGKNTLQRQINRERGSKTIKTSLRLPPPLVRSLSVCVCVCLPRTASFPDNQPRCVRLQKAETKGKPPPFLHKHTHTHTFPQTSLNSRDLLIAAFVLPHPATPPPHPNTIKNRDRAVPPTPRTHTYTHTHAHANHPHRLSPPSIKDQRETVW